MCLGWQKWSFVHLPGFLLKPVIIKVNAECGVKEGGLRELPESMRLERGSEGTLWSSLQL